MKSRGSKQKQDSDLRKLAEKKLKSQKIRPKIPSDTETHQLIHELQVHQIELEMKNTELREAQQKLEESRDKYSNLYDFAPIGYFSCDQKGTILEINLTGASQLGYERITLIGKPFTIHLRDREKQSKVFFSHLNRVFETGEKQRCEIKLRRKDGSEFEAQLESRASGQGGNTVCLTAMMDITERKRVEDKLLRSERRFRAFTEKASEFITVLDVTGVITFYSLGGNNTLGYTDEELMGRNVFELVHPADLPRTVELFRECISEPGKVVQTESRICAKDGSWRWLLTVGTNLLEDPAVGGVVLNSRDITDRKQIEMELHKLTEELERSNADLQEFAHVASHDLQEPLHSVEGFVRLLAKKYSAKLDEKADEYIEFAVDGVKLNSLLMVSKGCRRSLKIFSNILRFK